MSRAPLILAALLVAGCDDRSDTFAGGSDPSEWLANNPLATQDTWAGVDRVVCKPSVLDVCGAEECRPTEPKSYVVWRPQRHEYQRCDDNGCDTYAAEESYSGAFVYVTPAPRTALLKVATGGSFTEVASLMDATLVYRGQCERL